MDRVAEGYLNILFGSTASNVMSGVAKPIEAVGIFLETAGPDPGETNAWIASVVAWNDDVSEYLSTLILIPFVWNYNRVSKMIDRLEALEKKK